jgi:parallel beta-helix repeat protein
MKSSARLSICAILILGLAVLCTPSAATAASHTVHPGESIQAAVDAASPGDTVKVMPGDYTEPGTGEAAVRVTKPLKLLAKSRPRAKVRILPNTGQSHGILVEPANPGDPDIDGLRIKGFTVEGFSNMGIWLRHVKNFTIDGNQSINNLENGIFPTLSAQGLVKRNVSYGSHDAAMWVEGSENIRVISNEIHGSPTGLEITVSKEITVKRNNIHDNTIGVGLYHPATAGLGPGTPGLPPYAEVGYWHIIGNYVHDNNADNTGDPGSETSQLPKGGGILVLGSDHVDVQKNRVQNNDFFGIAIVDYCIAVAGTDFDCGTNPLPPELPDTSPDNNELIGNRLANNHTNPPPGPFQSVAADILALGGTGNCFSSNKFAQTPLTIPSPLVPGC